MRSMPRSRVRSWLTTTAPPFQRRSTSASRPRAPASRLLVGSSSRMTSGAAISRPARAARVIWPPLSSVAGREASQRDSPTSARAAATRPGRVQSASMRSSRGFRPLLRLDAAQPVPGGSDAQQVGQARARRRGVQLRQHADHAGAADRARGRRARPGDQRQQRGLAHAVAAHEADALGPDRQVQIVEENAAVRRGGANGIQGDEGGHGKPRSGQWEGRNGRPSQCPWWPPSIGPGFRARTF
jgi:hypothetical protein